MKRSFSLIVFALLLCAGAPPVHAEDGSTVDAGMKMWLHNWHRDQPGFTGISSDTTMLLGPAIEARMGEQVFLEASFLHHHSQVRAGMSGCPLLYLIIWRFAALDAGAVLKS